MRLSIALAAIATMAAALSVAPAEAAKKQRGLHEQEMSSQTRTRTTRQARRVRTAAAPPRARITVQRRSYLDAGTEVLPGERKFLDYAIPPGYSPIRTIDPFGGWDRQPLPSRWDLPGVRPSW